MNTIDFIVAEKINATNTQKAKVIFMELFIVL